MEDTNGETSVPVQDVPPEEGPDRELLQSQEEALSRPLSNRVPTLSARAALSRTPIRMLDSAPSKEDLETPHQEPIPEEPHILITEVPFTERTEVFPEEVEEDAELGEQEETFLEAGEVVEPEPEVFEDVQFVTVETVGEEEPPELRDEDFDTDLEVEEEEEKDFLVCQYEKVCSQLGVVPISYFVRHIKDPNVTMRFHGLGGPAAKALALVLKDNIHIEKLNLQGNWIEELGGEAMARMLEENDYITDLNLADNKICNEGAVHLCRMLLNNGGLRKFDLSGNYFDDKVAEHFADALEKNRYLQELNLSHNRFGEDGGELLGPAIGSNDNLDVIDLSWNHLRLRGAAAIAKGLKENIRLKVCRLAWNGFGPEGGAIIAEAIATNQSLLEIDLSGNRLNSTVAVIMAKTIAVNDTLKVIRMGNNLLTTAGAIALATAISNTDGSEMEELDITDVPVEYEFIRVIEEIKMKRPDFKVKHGPVLRSGNTVQDIGKPAIDPFKRKDPVVVLREHIVVNDMRLVDILKRYDAEGKFLVTPDDFLAALDELAVPYDKKTVSEAVERLAEDQSGRIYFGDYALQQELAQKKGPPENAQIPQAVA